MLTIQPFCLTGHSQTAYSSTNLINSPSWNTLYGTLNHTHRLSPKDPPITLNILSTVNTLFNFFFTKISVSGTDYILK